MFRQKFIALLLGMALLALGAAFAQTFDFRADLTTFSTFALADLSQFAPATADVNGNGILDAVEFDIIEEAVDGGYPFSAAVLATVNANIAQATTDLGGTGNSLLPSAKRVLAAYATLGNDDSWAVTNAILEGSGDFGGNTTPTRSAYDETQGTVVGPCADADSDGVKNVNELAAAANAAAGVTAIFAAGTTDTAYDHYGNCGNYGFLKANVFDPATGIVYGHVASETTFAQAEAQAASVNISGAIVEGGVLAKVHSGTLNAQLFAISGGEDAWFGATDRDVEGDWRWISDNSAFWSGATGGAAVGGAYENWRRNPGLVEPNDSGGAEDFGHMRGGDGMWNDVGAGSTQEGFFYQLPTVYADANTDGIPDLFLDADLNGIPDGLAGDAVVVNVQGGADPTLFVGGTLQLVAISDPGDTHTFTSVDTGVLTVDASSGLVTGVAAGGTNVNVVVASGTGLGEYVQGTIALTVTVPEWFEVCTIDNTFAAQFDALGGFGFDDDNELGSGDGVPDAWQLHLLAYALCTDAAKSLDDPAEATAAYNANLALMPGFISDVTTNYVPRVAGLVASAADIVALQAKFDTGGSAAACDPALAGLGIPSIAAVLQDVVDASGDLFLLSLADGLIAGNSQALAGMATTSTELGLTLNAGLDDLLRGDVNQILQLLGAIATPAMFGGLAGACPGSPETEATAILTAAGYSIPADSALLTGGSAIAALATPSWVALQDSAKTAGEPLAGAGDYDGDGTTNAEVATIIQGQGGDEDDFVVAASGGFGPFWPGNFALPVGGMVTLGALFSAMGAAGALVLRRKK